MTPALESRLDRMENCSYLLPDPGGEVNRALLAALRVAVEALEAARLGPSVYAKVEGAEFDSESNAAEAIARVNAILGGDDATQD